MYMLSYILSPPFSLPPNHFQPFPNHLLLLPDHLHLSHPPPSPQLFHPPPLFSPSHLLPPPPSPHFSPLLFFHPSFHFFPPSFPPQRQYHKELKAREAAIDEPEVANYQYLGYLLEQANIGMNREEMVRRRGRRGEVEGVRCGDGEMVM